MTVWTILLLLIILAACCGPSFLVLIEEVRAPDSGGADRYARISVGLAATGFVALAAAYLILYFPAPGSVPRVTAPAGGIAQGQSGGALQSLSCERARQRLDQLVTASRGSIVYAEGRELRMSGELWQQMPPEARGGIAGMIATVADCADSVAEDDAVIIRELRSGEILEQGSPAELASGV